MPKKKIVRPPFAKVTAYPNCDFCKLLHNRRQPARYDGALTREGIAVGGHAWANMCNTHHRQFGVGVGIGKGTLLVKTDDV